MQGASRLDGSRLDVVIRSGDGPDGKDPALMRCEGVVSSDLNFNLGTEI